MSHDFIIQNATSNDIPLIFSFIKELAEYEKLSHEVVATEAALTETLFGEQPKAEVIIGYLNGKPVAFALYFYNYSTFLGQPGLYLEDLFVRSDARQLGIGFKMLVYLAKLAKSKNCGRLEWWVLDWNTQAIDFYRRIGAKPMDEWTVFRLTEKELTNLAETN